MSKEDIRGKVVVVTEASSGNGKAMALLLADRGARLVLAASRAELLEATALEAEGLGGEVLAVSSCDVTLREQVEAMAGAALERFGRVDAWIDNAGVIPWSLFENTTEEEFRRTLEVNLIGAVYGSWAALPVMRHQGSGVIVNIASTAALVALPVGSAYSASKAGLFAFGDSLRRELKGSGIRVCRVLPVGVNTAGFFHQRTCGFRLSRRIAFLLQDPETVVRAVVRCIERPGTRNLPLGLLQGKDARALQAPSLPASSTSSAVSSPGSSERTGAPPPPTTTCSRPASPGTTSGARARAPITTPPPTLRDCRCRRSPTRTRPRSDSGSPRATSSAPTA